MSCTEIGTVPYRNALRDSGPAGHDADAHPGLPPNFEGGILGVCKSDKLCQLLEAYLVKAHKDGRASMNRAMENNGIQDNIKI